MDLDFALRNKQRSNENSCQTGDFFLGTGDSQQRFILRDNNLEFPAQMEIHNRRIR